MSFEAGVFVVAFCAMVCWGAGDFLIQKSTRRIGDIESLAFIGLIGTVGLLPLMIHDFDLLFSLPNLILLLVLAVFTFVAALFDFEALRIGKLSTADVILELELPVTIALGYIFFKEGLSAPQFFIIAIIFAGILLMATKSFSHFRMKWEKGVLMALLAAVAMGLINFLTSASSRHVSPIMAIWAPWFVVTLFCLVVIWKRGEFPKFVQDASSFKFLIIFMGIIDTAAWLFYSFAVFDANIGVVTAITESYPAVAIFLGVWLNKERINWHQYLGAGLTIAACIVLALFV
jgi:drug/metabolite transporter (DMT)-like permease